jgi:probable LLM family oxidoreductase
MGRRSAAPSRLGASRERRMELGIYNFGELATDPSTGDRISPHLRMRYLLDEIELADRVGLDVFGVGEHHRPDFVVSAPAVVLAAAASRTERIRLSSAVSVIGSDDPVRVFQDFASLDLIAGGRAEIMAGKGGFAESFPLFGFDLADNDELFAEKLDLLLRVRDAEHVTWNGQHRPPLDGLGVYPRPLQEELPVWVANTGNPTSAIRVGTLGLPLALGIVWDMPARLKPIARAHRRAAQRAGHATPAFAVNAAGYVAEDTATAIEESFEPLAAMLNRIGAERGIPPVTRADYERACSLEGPHFVGSPEDVTAKILHQHELFGHDRTLVHFAVGSLAHEGTMRAIELFGTEVAPAVRSALA